MKPDLAFQRYTTQGKPNYPVPATMDNAMLALFHDGKTMARVWTIEYMKRKLKENANF